MQSLGKTLRQIRNQKNMSIDDIIGDVISKSQISRFELGYSEITATTLIAILDNLHVTLEEFNQLNPTKTQTTQFLQSIPDLIESAELGDLAYLSNYLHRHHSSLSPLEITMIKAMMATIDPQYAPSPEEISHFTDYLFSLDLWTNYEIVLLGNSISILTTETIYQLTLSTIKLFLNPKTSITNRSMVIQLANRTFLKCIEEKEITKARVLEKEIPILLQQDHLYYEKNVFLYLQGYLQTVDGKKSGFEQMKNAIQVFSLVKEETLAQIYEKHYQNITVNNN